jgi:hypothetical protein
MFASEYYRTGDFVRAAKYAKIAHDRYRNRLSRGRMLRLLDKCNSHLVDGRISNETCRTD